MLCLNCNSIHYKKYYVIQENNYKYILKTICAKCNYSSIRPFVIKPVKPHKKIMNIHLPNYNYCGPWTDLFYNLKNKVKCINLVDEACMLHDILYNIYKDPVVRTQLDKILIYHLKDNNINSNSSCIIKLALRTNNFLR